MEYSPHAKGICMNWDKASTLLRRIEEIDDADSRLNACKRNFFDLAIRYARIRADWRLADRNQRDRRNEERTRAHNAWIDACHILSRQMQSQGLDNSWREELGVDRLGIGDFACYIHCILGLRAR